MLDIDFDIYLASKANGPWL